VDFEAKRLADSGAVPLQTAVLCVDCECVTEGRFEECAVCGSRSLLSISRIVGGTLVSRQVRPRKEENGVLFDMDIKIELKRIEPKDLSATVEGVASLIGPRLGRGRAFCHINVEPVASIWESSEPRAA
jgi:hypothetical protein